MVMQVRVPSFCRSLVRGSWDSEDHRRYVKPIEDLDIITPKEKEEGEKSEFVVEVVVPVMPEKVDVGEATEDYVQL